MLSSAPSTQIKNNLGNHRLENAVTDICLDSEQRQDHKTRFASFISVIHFEEYINFWMKIATTNSDVLMTRESLDELMRYTERFATPHGNEACDLIEAQRSTLKWHSHVEKLQNKGKRKHNRVENMRRLYMQSKVPELLTPVQDPDGMEHWEQEMDELVKWTNSLSLKELDDP